MTDTHYRYARVTVTLALAVAVTILAAVLYGFLPAFIGGQAAYTKLEERVDRNEARLDVHAKMSETNRARITVNEAKISDLDAKLAK